MRKMNEGLLIICRVWPAPVSPVLWGVSVLTTMPMTGRLTDSSWADESSRLSPRIKARAGADWDRPSIAYKANSKLTFSTPPSAGSQRCDFEEENEGGEERKQKRQEKNSTCRHSEKNAVNGLKFLCASSRPVGVAGIWSWLSSQVVSEWLGLNTLDMVKLERYHVTFLRICIC